MYMCIVLCYFTYYVTDPVPCLGFFNGLSKVVVLRVLIALFTLMQVCVQAKRLQYTGKRYFTLKNIINSLLTSSMYGINLWIVIEHSNGNRRVS
jgi:hypothetical protein